MADTVDVFLAKAQESLAGAESEFANDRYNNCANRCYYACFQGAIYALRKAGMRPRGANAQWSIEDTDEVMDVLIDRLVDMQVEEGLPVYVIPVRPIERVVESLRREGKLPLRPIGHALLD